MQTRPLKKVISKDNLWVLKINSLKQLSKWFVTSGLYVTDLFMCYNNLLI